MDDQNDQMSSPDETTSPEGNAASQTPSAPVTSAEAPADDTINIVSPTGELKGVSPDELGAAINAGYRRATPDDEAAHKSSSNYGSMGQQLATGAEGVAQGVLSAPVSNYLENKIGGVPYEDILGREKENPWWHGGGETAGLAGGMLTGVGEGAVAAKLGEVGLEAASKLVPKALAEKAPELVSRLGSIATKAAIENGFIGGMDEKGKSIAGDPDASVGNAIIYNGLGGALIGGGLGAVSPLWKTASESKLGQVLSDFKGRLQFHLDNPDQVAALTDELQQHYNKNTDLNDSTWGPKGLKAADIAKAMPEMHNGILEQSSKIAKDIRSTVKTLQEDGVPRANELSRLHENYVKAVMNPDATPGTIFDAQQNLKQNMQEWADYGKRADPADKPVTNAARKIAIDLRQSLEDTDVWGKAAERQQAINGAFSKFIKPLQFFEKRFTVDTPQGRQVDAGKVNTYLNQLGKPAAEIKQSMLKDYIDASDNFANTISKTHDNLGLDNPLPQTPLGLTRQTLGKLTPGAKLADYVVQKGAANVSGGLIGAGIGSILGHTVGLGDFGGLIGEHALGPTISAILPNLIKPFMGAATDSGAFKSSADYIADSLKGNDILNKATKSIFKAGREVLPQSFVPTEKDRNKLDKYVTDVSADPQKGVPNTNGMATYMPGHAQAVGVTAANTINYIKSQKPNTDKTSPLDQTPTASATAKSSYNRALNIAQQPLVVLEHLNNGTLIPQDVVAIQTMYPALYKKISDQLHENMITHLSKGEPIPYNTRIGLSMFLAQPLDSTMQPTSIQAAQPPPPTPPQQGGKSSTKNLSKVADMAKTPGQAKEQQEQSGKP